MMKNVLNIINIAKTGKNLFLVGLVLLITACTTNSERYIRISVPVDGAVIDLEQPLIIKGTGRGLYENNVVIQLQDRQGGKLIQISTIMKTKQIGGEGVWQKRVLLTETEAKEIQLIANSPSPKKGDMAISSRPIMLNIRTIKKTTLDNTEWQLNRYQNESGKTSPVLPQTSISAAFKGNKVSGNAGCNRYSSQFQIPAKGLFHITKQIGSTMMACAPETAEQEQQYLKNLAMATQHQLNNGNLLLLNKNQQVLLEYLPAKPLVLENSIWQATGINNGQGGVVSNKNTHLATVSFSQGKAQGNTGCNNFSISYELNNQKIHFGKPMSTRKFCAEDGIMDQEQQFLQALTNTVNYEFKEGQLDWRDHKGSLMVSFQKQKQ